MGTRLTAALAAAALASAAGCADWPELDRRAGAADAPYPEILPLDGLLAQAAAPGRAEAEAAELEARAAALRARAAALRAGPG